MNKINIILIFILLVNLVGCSKVSNMEESQIYKLSNEFSIDDFVDSIDYINEDSYTKDFIYIINYSETEAHFKKYEIMNTDTLEIIMIEGDTIIFSLYENATVLNKWFVYEQGDEVIEFLKEENRMYELDRKDRDSTGKSKDRRNFYFYADSIGNQSITFSYKYEQTEFEFTSTISIVER